MEQTKTAAAPHRAAAELFGVQFTENLKKHLQSGTLSAIILLYVFALSRKAPEQAKPT